MSFRLDPRGVGKLDSSSGGLWLLRCGALVATVCRDMGVFFWLAVDLKKDKTGLHFLGFWGGLGFSFPLGSRWVALLFCGHGSGASFILGFWGGAWMVGIWGVVEEQWRLGDLVSRVNFFLFIL